MIDLLLQVGNVFLVLTVISLFLCTIPLGFVVLVVVFCCGDFSLLQREQVTLVIKKGEEGWLIYKVRKSGRTRLRIAPLQTLEEARAIAVFGFLACDEITRIRYED